jgi:hypothetical protein
VTQLPGDADIGAGITASHLRPTRQAGADEVPALVERQRGLKARDKRDLLGTRPDEAHLAAQDVPELGQLVAVRAAHDPTDRRRTRVVVLCPRGLVARAHGTQLVETKRPAAVADARLDEQRRPAVAAHEQREQTHHRQRCQAQRQNRKRASSRSRWIEGSGSQISGTRSRRESAANTRASILSYTPAAPVP